MVKNGYTTNKAIEIVKIGIESIKAETMHHKNEALSEALTNQYIQIESEEK